MSSGTELVPHWFARKTFGPRSPVGVPREELLPWYEHPRSTTRLNAFSIPYLKVLPNFRSSDLDPIQGTAKIAIRWVHPLAAIVERQGVSWAYYFSLSVPFSGWNKEQADRAKTLSTRAECALLAWIPVNSQFCAVRLGGSVSVNWNIDVCLL